VASHVARDRPGKLLDEHRPLGARADQAHVALEYVDQLRQFVQQFKQRIPQYMVRHRVKSGITGWAQVNGWRGNTSLEKRIEFDLYYIENWSLLLDVKILILTLFRGFGQKHAY